MTKKRTLRRGDYHQPQMFQPHGPCAIEKASLAGLWSVVSKGSKWVEYYSYLAALDPCQRGVSISLFAQSLKYAMDHFREQRVQHVMKPELYAAVKAVVDEIYPKLEVLDGGSKFQGAGFRGLAYDDRTRKAEDDVKRAAKDVYAWLQSPNDPFRAYLQIFSGSGVVYSAQCEEKVMRAYIGSIGGREDTFVDASVKRLCTEEGQRTGARSADDSALTQSMGG